MAIVTGKDRPIRLLASVLLVIVAFAVLLSSPKYPPIRVSAHSGPVFGPACGAATIDGVVDAVEWSSASTQTFQMVSPGGADPFTATLYVMDDGYDLFVGITINDDEFSTIGTWLPQGDGFRIDFDNDHSGSLFALGDDVLAIAAGSPQFDDAYIYNEATKSATSDVDGGGTADGVGAASRVAGLNHFELRHPLCSGDSLDFCLHPGDTVGFRLEYLDAEADGSFGGNQLFPGSGDTSEADIVIAQCSVPNWFIYLPLIKKSQLGAQTQNQALLCNRA
jgi:hypothetical protein